MLNFIRSFWKKQRVKITLAAVIAILTGIIGLGFFFFQEKLKKEIETKNRMAEIIHTRQVQYTDNMGKLVTEVTEQRVTIEEYKQMVENGDVEKSKLKKQVEAMGVKLKMVETMGNMSFETKYDSIPVFVYISDSGNENESYCDDYISLFRTKELGSDTAIYDINIKDSLIWSIDWYFKDKWKFKNIFMPRDKYYKLNAKLLNPKAEITYSRFYKFPKKKKDKR